MTSRRAGLLAALFASALALRPQIVGVGPLLPAIQADLGLKHAVAGLLGTIPVLCMGLFALRASAVAAWLGSRRAIGLAVLLIGVAGVARSLVPGAPAVIALTLPIGIGIAIAGTLMPVAVKERFHDRPAYATGIYTTGINAGSAIAAAIAVPLATLVDWRLSLLAFSGAAVAVGLVWLVATRGEPEERVGDAARPALPLRNALAWVLVLMFALLAVGFYGINQWLPDSFVERGWSETGAGGLLGALNVASIPGSFVLGALAERWAARRRLLVTCGIAVLVAVLGLVLVPEGAWAWASLYGFTNGGLFALIMTLPLDTADRPGDVGAMAGMMLGIGYSVGAVSPFLLGAIRDATGTFTGSLWTIVGTAAVFVVGAASVSGERLARRRPLAVGG